MKLVIKLTTYVSNKVFQHGYFIYIRVVNNIHILKSCIVKTDR